MLNPQQESQLIAESVPFSSDKRYATTHVKASPQLQKMSAVRVLTSDLAEELVSIVGSGRITHLRRQLWQENSSASSDMAKELVSVVGSGRRTRQLHRIWPENSSASSDLAGELVSVVESGRRTHSCRR
ncbi:hypothetical protein DY000_02009198 [Brassica cretica]|uniref:Uncharacterized protein n=1 Tax=Brassica cretica TaxID=69181 RepID=A0ABQ7C0C5_BRACR|nr:hypothetical protein DY000_02009198 [Brassica cretica]